MGWSASDTSKHSDLGEIPGIRELSDETRETLEKNDPNGGIYDFKKNMEKRKQSIIDGLDRDYDEYIVKDTRYFIEAWIDCADGVDEPFNPLSPTFLDDIKIHLVNTNNNTLNADDVYDITCRTQLRPTMFYFGVNIDEKTNKPYTVVVRRDYWNENKTLVDINVLSDFVVPDFLTCPIDSRYEIIDDMTPSEVRRLMIKHGFVEKHEVAGL